MRSRILRTMALLTLLPAVQIAMADVPAGWRQVNQDGFGYDATDYQTELFVAGSSLYAKNEDGLFRMLNPDSKAWQQVTVPSAPSGPGTQYLGRVGSYVYGRDSQGHLWQIPEGADLGGTGWIAVTSIGLPGGAAPSPWILFKGSVYGVYYPSSQVFEIWRSPDVGQSTMTWTRVVANSFGDPANNVGVDSVTACNDRLYVGTDTLLGMFGYPGSYGAGVEVWESVTGNLGSWSQANQNGFGTTFEGCISGVCNFAIHQVIGAAAAYSGIGEAQERLYIGTKAHYGAEMFRYAGSGPSGWQNVTPPGAGYGFGLGPSRIEDTAVYNGELYAAEGFPTAYLAKYDGADWSIVVNGPYPFDPDNQGLQSLAVCGDKLYVTTIHKPYSGVTQGDQVWELAVPPPANDTCSAAEQIESLPYEATLDTTSAITALGDPELPCCSGQPLQQSRSVWFVFNAFADAQYEVSTEGSGYDTVLAVFTGTCGSLAQVDCNDDAASGYLHSVVRWNASAGVTFHIEVTAYGANAGGDLHLLLKGMPPPNDDCANAIQITDTPYSIIQEASGATTALDDPIVSCAHPYYLQQSHSLWYAFTAADTMWVAASTIGSNYDTVVAVFTGNCGQLAQVACNDDLSIDRRVSWVRWLVEKDQTYFVEVTSYGQTTANMLYFWLEEVAPANDDCTDAIALAEMDGSEVNATRFATTGTTEPVPSCHPSYNTVWYKLTPAQDGIVILSTEGSDFDTVLAVYTGAGLCTGGPYSEKACSDDAIGTPQGTRWSAAALLVMAGVTYMVQVGSYSQARTGNLTLSYHLGGPGSSISAAKCKPIGDRVTLYAKRIADYVYACPAVQEPDRSCGIYVGLPYPRLSPGTKVAVVGTLAKADDGNLYITDPGGYVGMDYPVEVKPVGMSTRSVGGSSFCGQAGVSGGAGPNNTGLWVRTWGWVTSTDPASDCYWIDDGCGLSYNPGRLGLCVLGTPPLPQVGTFKVVTGMPWMWSPAGTPIIVEPAPPAASDQAVRQRPAPASATAAAANPLLHR